ncbi:MAG: FRG domain-containing protein [Nannocystales bacterium]
MKTRRVKTLAQYVSNVGEVRRQWARGGKAQELWFRGINDRSLSILPGAVWREDCDDVSMFNMFQRDAPAYLSPPPVDEWSWYFAAQHYGLPTRLADWSASPLISLFFALQGVSDGACPCVWMMDAGKLNKITQGDDEVYVAGLRFSEHWLPSHVSSGEPTKTFQYDGKTFSNELPIALQPYRTTPRIIAQQGVFTVHGSGTASLEEIFEAGEKSDQQLARIDLEDVPRLTDELEAFGFDAFTVFPEVDKLAERLKRQYQP